MNEDTIHVEMKLLKRIEHLEYCLLVLCSWIQQAGLFGVKDVKAFKDILEEKGK